MKRATLSNHAGDQLRAASAKREHEYAAALADYQAALAERESRFKEIRHALGKAFLGLRLLRALFLALKLLFLWLSSGPRPPKRQGATRDEAVWSAGAEGEQRVADALGAQLSDHWLLFSGYKNSGGEIDQILVGPNGVVALEIKFVNGVVHCEGDRWWRDKYDQYGNEVETGLPIQDKRGRGPSVQVNAAADKLEAFLKKRTGVKRVVRAVVVAHENSELGSIKKPTVDFVATTAHLTRDVIARSLNGHPLIDPRHVADQIKKDHEYHARPRSSARERSGAAATRSVRQ